MCNNLRHFVNAYATCRKWDLFFEVTHSTSQFRNLFVRNSALCDFQHLFFGL